MRMVLNGRPWTVEHFARRSDTEDGNVIVVIGAPDTEALDGRDRAEVEVVAAAIMETMRRGLEERHGIVLAAHAWRSAAERAIEHLDAHRRRT
jgi:hypothetical protein